VRAGCATTREARGFGVRRAGPANQGAQRPATSRVHGLRSSCRKAGISRTKARAAITYAGLGRMQAEPPLSHQGARPPSAGTPNASFDQGQPARDLPPRHGRSGRMGAVYPGRAKSQGSRGNANHFPAPGRGFTPVTVHAWPAEDLALAPELGHRPSGRSEWGEGRPGAFNVFISLTFPWTPGWTPIHDATEQAMWALLIDPTCRAHPATARQLPG
jgi:hypothetical protein